jgi:hypothetical protein
MLTIENALAEEALLTAEAMMNRHDYYVRGGPWHGLRMGYKGNLEARQVSRIAYRWRDDRAQARVEVHVYAASRNDESSLKRHLEDRPFVRDSAEPARLEAWPSARKARGSRGASGKSRSGAWKRRGMDPTSLKFKEHKYGGSPTAVKKKENRKAWLKKRPGAMCYKPRKR